MKKLTALFLTAVLFTSMLAAPASAASPASLAGKAANAVKAAASSAAVNAKASLNDLTFVYGTGSDTYYRVTKNNAPLRVEAHDQGAVIVRLPKNQLVKVKSTFTTWKGTKWARVEYRNASGKAATAYIYTGNVIRFSNKVNQMRSYAAAAYEETALFKNWKVSKAAVLEAAGTVSSTVQVDKLMNSMLKAKLDKAVGKSMDISSYNRNTYYTYIDDAGVTRTNWGLYRIEGGCTWYAFNRYLQICGGELLFKGAGGGNANTWDDRIVTSQFRKIPSSKLTNGTRAAVAVDNQGAPINGVYYGHVAFIEAVIDGNVYYSDGWYDGGFHSRLCKVSLKSFASTYETVILPM